MFCHSGPLHPVASLQHLYPQALVRKQHKQITQHIRIFMYQTIILMVYNIDNSLQDMSGHPVQYAFTNLTKTFPKSRLLKTKFHEVSL